MATAAFAVRGAVFIPYILMAHPAVFVKGVVQFIYFPFSFIQVMASGAFFYFHVFGPDVFAVDIFMVAFIARDTVVFRMLLMMKLHRGLEIPFITFVFDYNFARKLCGRGKSSCGHEHNSGKRNHHRGQFSIETHYLHPPSLLNFNRQRVAWLHRYVER
jgi:hypothetical protein